VRAVRGLVASGLFGVALTFGVWRSLTATPKHDPRLLGNAVAHEAYLATTDREAEERREAAFRFQGSPWSQEDDYFAKETSFIKRYAGDHKITIGSILVALDRGMREKWATHPDVVVNPKVVPCRPRLAYR
jgi:hypothetical protein